MLCLSEFSFPKDQKIIMMIIMINVCNTKSAHLTIICLANVFAASVQIRLKYLLTYTLTIKINNFYGKLSYKNWHICWKKHLQNSRNWRFKLKNKIRNSVHTFEIWILLHLFWVQNNTLIKIFSTLWQLWSLISPSFQETQLFPNILNYF